jgi:membrane protease YdiL (CAAX protease family)
LSFSLRSSQRLWWILQHFRFSAFQLFGISPFAMAPNSTTDGLTRYRGAVAPAWHTLIVLLVLFGFSFASAHAGSLTPFGPKIGRAFGYIVVIIFEWALVAFIWFGTSQRGIRIADLVGGSWARPIHVLRDIAIAVTFLIVATGVLGALDHFVKTAPNQAIRNLLPQGPIEDVLFLATSLTAGFCEELIYRGYLQRQFTALTHAVTGGIVLQAIAFALTHGYQGWRFVLLIAVLATMLGLLAHWRKSLRPGMIAHALQDGVTGIVAAHVLR